MPSKNTHATLQEALIAFQKDLPEVGLDATNPHFRSKYASLANITKKVFPKLSEHGLSFSVGSFVDNGVLILDAHLIHESGTSRSMQVPTREENPQKLGSFISYMRRYALAALTGIVADEDDDGNVASAPSPAAVRQAQARKVSSPARGEDDNQAKLRKWIGDDATRKDTVNGVYERLKGEGKSGADLWAAVAGEVLG
jgi:hypothetical protein